ncbi:GTP 3',8-cyclase MoaA [Bacillus horti]|uniref:GTP 3',8-cyclase n=1 Tax=Caldalkalibacillus horti TaxID=77523 RepID=A0ABT9W2E5_9BACI|nr:GTP 3',8-cyclase MoaA [Bacillus horti]MDQ0167424.1 cyclic pyranopterin phosphate synthase [Bacillus horti]
MKDKLKDSFGRVHDYLRISVTDRCNLRCVYCMPEEGMVFEPSENILTATEIASVVRVLAELGVRKIRLTGGEPLVRKDIVDIVSMISDVQGIEDIALTTNGIFLGQKAADLKKAGLTRVNISLDSLRADRFSFITRGGTVKRVLQSIDICEKLDLTPLKLNVVLMKGINDDEILDFLEMSLSRAIQIRFIEYMPIGHQTDSWKSSYMPLSHVLEQCEGKGWEVEASEHIYGNGPAENYRIKGAKGSFGLIHPVSDHFCEACNRLRLMADGSIKSCLYWSDERNVRKYIGDDQALKEMFFKALGDKPKNHEMAQALNDERQTHTPTLRRMSQIGG